MPTLQFGKAIELFKYKRLFFGIGFDTTRGAVKGSITKRNDESRLLVLEGHVFWSARRMLLRQFTGLSGCHRGRRGRELPELLGVGLGW